MFWASLTTSQPAYSSCFPRYLYVFKRKWCCDCCHIAFSKKKKNDIWGLDLKNGKRIRVKVNLHSIRFSSVFLRFCFFLLKYALFHPHFYKFISALRRLLYIVKNFVQKFCVWTLRAIFQNQAVPLYKKNFRKAFVQYVTVWLVRIWTYKNADEKAHTFSRRSKNVKKRTKTDEKRILCKFTLRVQVNK